MSLTKPFEISANAGLWTGVSGVLAHPNSPIGGGGPGRFAAPGPLGREVFAYERFPHPDSPATRHRAPATTDGSPAIADRRPNARPESAALKKAGSSASQGVLNLYGWFSSIWKGRPDDEVLVEIDKVAEHPELETWFPGSPELDFFGRSMGGIAWPVASIEQALCKILEYKPSRVNIFSHAISTGDTMMAGTITAGNVDGVGSSFTGAEILKATKNGFSCKDETVNLGQVKSAFGKNPEIYLYACHSGKNQQTLDEIRDALYVTVYGFMHSILYFPVTNPQMPKTGRRPRNTKIIGWEWGYEGAQDIHVRTYGELHPDMSSSAKPDPKPRCEVRQWY